MVSIESQLRRCADIRSSWLELLASENNKKPSDQDGLIISTNGFNLEDVSFHSPVENSTEYTNSVNCSEDGSCSPMATFTFNSILDSLTWITRGLDNRLQTQHGVKILPVALPPCIQSADHVQVLCTGSLHLVGGVLSLLEPDVCNK